MRGGPRARQLLTAGGVACGGAGEQESNHRASAASPVRRPVALITGATSGVGAACVRALGRAGYDLVLTGRRGARLEAVAAELRGPSSEGGAGAAVHTLLLDVRDREAVRETLGSLPEAFDRVELLIPNAGLALGTPPPTRPRSRTGSRWCARTSTADSPCFFKDRIPA